MRIDTHIFDNIIHSPLLPEWSGIFILVSVNLKIYAAILSISSKPFLADWAHLATIASATIGGILGLISIYEKAVKWEWVIALVKKHKERNK